jgi:hypothetical protein
MPLWKVTVTYEYQCADAIEALDAWRGGSQRIRLLDEDLVKVLEDGDADRLRVRRQELRVRMHGPVLQDRLADALRALERKDVSEAAHLVELALRGIQA